MTKDRISRLAAVAVAATLVLAGCGDNAGNPVGYAPEGQSGGAILLLTTIPTAADSSGLFLFATVLSPPPANGFSVYLNPANEGFRAATDAPIPPVITLTSGWSVYQTVVSGYDPAQPSQVVARGARDGLESAAAAVSNVAFIPAGTPLSLLRVDDIALGLPADSAVTSPRPTLTWDAVPGATRYIVQLVDPAGVVAYVATTTGTTHQVAVGPGIALQALPLRNAGLYKWSIQAFDAGSRLTGLSREDRSLFIASALP